MANALKIKRRALGGSAGAPSSLAVGELAYNEVDNILYYGRSDGTILSLAGSGAYPTLSGTNTFTGAITFSGSVSLGASATATTPATADNSTKVATTAFVKAQSYLTANQTVTASGDVSGSGTTAITLTLAASGVTAGTYSKVTVDAKGRVTSGASLVAGDIPTLTVAKLSDFAASVTAFRLDQFAAPTASVSLNSQRLVNLAAPVADTDAATKAYVDAIAQGLDPKQSVKAATTANIASLSGAMTIDGIALVAGDRVLVKDQTTSSANGIYVVSAAAWARAVDADTWAKLVSAYVFVEAGTTNADVGYYCNVDQGGTLGTTSIFWVQFSGAGQITAGAGLTKTGNQIDIVSASASRITVNADSIDLAPTGVTAGTVNGITFDAWGRITSAVDGGYLNGSSVIDGGMF